MTHSEPASAACSPVPDPAAAAFDPRYRATLDTLLEPLILLRPIVGADGTVEDFTYDYANLAACAANRTTQAEQIGRRLLDAIPQALPMGMMAALVAVLTSGDPLVLDGIRYLDTRDAPPVEHVVDVRIHRIEGSIVCTWRDVTDASRAQDALKASELRYQHLVDRVSVGTYVARDREDGYSVFEWVSPQFGRIADVDPDAAMRDPMVVYSKIHADDLRDILERTVASHHARRRFSWEGRGTVRGETRIIRAVAEPDLSDPDVVRWHGFIEDITDQRRAEEQLRTSETRFRLLADNTHDVVWTVDADGDVSYISPAVERFRGFTPEEAMAQPVEEIHPPESVAINLAYFEALEASLAARTTPASLHQEMAYLHRNGSTVWADVHVIPRVGSDGRLIEVVGVSRDISERKRHETAQRRFSEELERRVTERTAELEAANEELRSFSYSVSHDLRAPVRAVAGFARILERDLGEQLDPDARHKLQNIRTAGESMGRLIDDLLSYTRVGQGAVRCDPLSVAAIVDQVRISLAPRLAETEGIIELAEPVATPCGDRSLLDRILLNLAENALTYHRPGVPPRVTIAARATPAGSVEISVSDNGIGIPGEALDRIFEVFTRLSLDADATRSGIGLATVRKAARAMGSEVEVVSEVGAGTTFRIRLPAVALG